MAKWTEARKAELCRMWDAGDTGEAIASALNTSRGRVNFMAQKLGCAPRKRGRPRKALKARPAPEPSKTAAILTAFRNGLGFEDMQVEGICTADEARAVIRRLRQSGVLPSIINQRNRAGSVSGNTPAVSNG